MTIYPVSKKMKLLLQELLKDSSRSDRELAKALGTSQPTLSRLRKKLVQCEFVKNYTVIPDFYKMGYRILAITLVKSKFNFASPEQRELSDTRARTWMMKKPNVVFCDYCRGLGMDGIMISLHKSYQEFDEFMIEHNSKLGIQIKESQNILINFKEEDSVKPFNLKYLAEDT